MSATHRMPAGNRFKASRNRAPVPPARGGLPVLILMLAFAPLLALLPSCQGTDRVEEQKSRPLTPDERYLVDLYTKITEIEENLQDNPDALEEKRRELREEIDLERIERVLIELEKDPERWLAIYNRILELRNRRRGEESS